MGKLDSTLAPAAPVILGGRYVLKRDGRTGAQASVVQAYDQHEGRVVAVKRMIAEQSDARAREGLQREIAMLENLKHPNIVELHEVDRDEAGNWFLILEWVPDTLEDIIKLRGPMTWPQFWDGYGRPLLDAVVFAQKRRIAHRDIKPRNILVAADGIPKLADYGIAKLLDRIGAWAPTSGHTFRFDYTPGYTPAEADDAEYTMSRDCYGFAAVAIACVSGTCFQTEVERDTAFLEAILPVNVREILASCLASKPGERPPLASVLASRLEKADAENARHGHPGQPVHLVLSAGARNTLRRKSGFEASSDIESFLLDELHEASSILLPEAALAMASPGAVDLIGVSWRFRTTLTGRFSEGLEIVSAQEIGAALASELRDRSLRRDVRFSLDHPRHPDVAGQDLRLLIADAADYQRDLAAEREAHASQRVFRVWRSFLRDRADLEAKRANALGYTHRRAAGDQVVFTTEIAASEDIVGQERVVTNGGVTVSGRISRVVFNQVTMDVNYGDASRLPRTGELLLNTIAAQRALEHQTSALNAVIYDRVANSSLKDIILRPSSAVPVIPVTGIEPEDDDFDDEKRSILAQAMGVAGVLAIEGPPGTGKTKLITEIVVQWLKRNSNDRILLSSQTHIALDNVLQRVSQLKPDLDMIRIGRSDETRISESSKAFLLDKRVEGWIAEIREKAERDMQRWADEHGVDRAAVSLGMKVERLLQVLEIKRELMEFVALQEQHRPVSELPSSGSIPDSREADEESTQIDSEIGECRQKIRLLRKEEGTLRADLETMGDYATALAKSDDPSELAEWADHFLAGDPKIISCRERLRLLEAWLLRVGRTSDFNGAMLASAQIIAGTCVGIAGVRGMEDVTYDLCIIDEASKATATEILIPMTRSKRWIVVGDPEQLPPFFEQFGDQLTSDFQEAEIRATLLDRFLEDATGLPTECRAALKNQYRMIKPIGDLISACFYHHGLNSPVKDHGLKLSAAIPLPVTWYSTHKLPARSEIPEGKTFANATEANVVRDVLRRLQFVSRAQRRSISVAVIAGYTAQVRLLSEIVSQGVAEWPDLEVSCNSVDAFQGQQADVCIYSVVRSNSRGDLGFLREKPRLNVALSRGKSALVIVGDYPFCQDAKGENPFKRVTQHIEEHQDECRIEVLS